MPATQTMFLNGVPELVVLRLLSRREMYGYELVKAIESCTQGALTFGEGCIYPVLHALQQRGLLRTRRMEAESGRSRQYYAMTAKGKRHLQKVTGQWQSIHAAVSALLDNGGIVHEGRA